MHKRVWIFQYPKDIKKKGANKASHYVGWYDQNGKRHAESCGPGSRGLNKAEKRKRQLQSELDMGLHQPAGKTKWSDFRSEYESKVLANLAPSSQTQIKASLDYFETIAKPGRMELIKTTMIDAFVAERRKQRGKNPKSKLSPATINKDLRQIKAALRVAVDWDYLPKMPRIRMLKEPEKIIRIVTPEHFALIYHDACLFAELPKIPDQPYEPKDWWQALTATAYMTGWRIGELLAMRREDVNFETSTIITRHGDNKGKRDELVPVHPVVLEQLRRVITDHAFVFRWCDDERNLWQEFGRIQRAAGIKLTCREDHEHTPPCHVYGFHDFRRAFATENADRMKPEALQKLMRHKAYLTTLGYVNMAKQVKDAVGNLHVPDVLKNGQ